MNRKFRCPRLLILAALVLAGVPSCRGDAASAKAPQPKAVVLPFTIEPLSLQGGPEPSGGQKLMALLAEKAASSAAQTMVSEGLAETVERSASSEAPTGQLTLRGTVRLPVRLPPDLHELRDDVQRGGPLATAAVVLLDADGKVMREAKAELDWREVHWRERSFRLGRDRSAEEVLFDAVEEVVRRAVQHLGQGVSPSSEILTGSCQVIRPALV